ncbi:DNA primase [Gordonia sihwensis]|uniref:DNA primase n=1 Tax=Gordonia sihwensis TaxID=173559 RepID=UPI00069642D6|nr:DNA primase [Gordonia sihwensis]
MRIPESFVDELRQRVPIADVIGDYVDLKQQGPLLVGCCPFHSERTPSFKVRPEYHRYRCYGCGESGDIFDFLSHTEGLDFRSAVEHLAGLAGLPVPDTGGRPDDADQSRNLRRTLDAAHTLLQSWLADPAAAAARTYLTDRKFTTDHIHTWQLGYNPPGTHLLDRMVADGHRRDDLAAAGLIKQSARDGRWYDYFGGRLIWPLHDPAGRLCGLAGRALTEQPRAKYLNSEESVIYHKGRMLYGLWHARRDILTTRTAIVVEGYTDVMALAAAGHPNTVASCGTAVSAEQADLLRARVGDHGHIVSGFDNDDAGRKGAWALFLACQDFTTQITAIDYSQYGAKADACDVRTRGSDTDLAELVNTQVPVLQLLIDADTDVPDAATPEQVALAAHHAAERLALVRSPILRDRYTQHAAARLNIPASALQANRTEPAVPAASTMSRPALDDDAVTLAAHLIDNPTAVDSALSAAGVGTLSELLPAPIANAVEISWCGFADGRPTESAAAQTWAEYMTTVLEPADHPLFWQIAFADHTSSTGPDLAIRLRRRQLQTIIATARTDPARADEYMNAHRHLRALRNLG